MTWYRSVCWGGAVASAGILLARAAEAKGLVICDCSSQVAWKATTEAFVPPLLGIAFFLGMLFAERKKVQYLSDTLVLGMIPVGAYFAATMVISRTFCPMCVLVWICAGVVALCWLSRMPIVVPTPARWLKAPKLVLLCSGLAAGVLWANLPPGVHPNCDTSEHCCRVECVRWGTHGSISYIANGYDRCKNPNELVPPGKAGCSHQSCPRRFYPSSTKCSGTDYWDEPYDAICCRRYDKPQQSPPVRRKASSGNEHMGM